MHSTKKGVSMARKRRERREGERKEETATEEF